MSLGFRFIPSCFLADGIHSSPSIIPVASVSLLRSFPAMFGFIALIIHFVPPSSSPKIPFGPFFSCENVQKVKKVCEKSPSLSPNDGGGKEEGGSQEEREERNRISRSHFPHFAQQPLLIAKSAKCRETRAEFFPMNKEKRNFSPSNSGNISCAQLG